MNIVEFLKTRKFWQQVIALVLTIVVWAIPRISGIEVTPEMLTVITVFLWTIASLIVHGDIRYDWINAQNQNARG